MRYLASVSYDGSKFYGFQKLNNHKTVQQCLEQAISKINKKPVAVKGAGRTDRGVHALGQGISFDLDVNVPVDRLKNAINSLLDDAIYIQDIKEVDDNFHARFSAKKKIYEYVINLGEYDAIRNDYLYNYNRSLDVMEMKKGAKKLEGAHSFKAFTSGERDNYNSIIYSVKIKKEKNLLIITFEGKSFYRYMVRNMVGVLIGVGAKKISVDVLDDMFEGKNVTYQTAPACGLYLREVFY